MFALKYIKKKKDTIRSIYNFFSIFIMIKFYIVALFLRSTIISLFIFEKSSY